jgi:uncharacterized protein DUF1937
MGVISEMKTFIYISSPYSHPDRNVREHRYHRALAYTAKLLQAQQWCYSPIVHCHNIAKMYNLPTDAEFWKDYNAHMMDAASHFHVLTISGWKESLGVQWEMEYWQRTSASEPKLV